MGKSEALRDTTKANTRAVLVLQGSEIFGCDVRSGRTAEKDSRWATYLVEDIVQRVGAVNGKADKYQISFWV